MACHRHRWTGALLVVAAMWATACTGQPSALQHSLEARRLAAELHQAFTAAAGATHDVGPALDHVETQRKALAPLLELSAHDEERQQLHLFERCFADDRRVDAELAALSAERQDLEARRFVAAACDEQLSALERTLEKRQENPTR